MVNLLYDLKFIFIMLLSIKNEMKYKKKIFPKNNIKLNFIQIWSQRIFKILYFF